MRQPSGEESLLRKEGQQKPIFFWGGGGGGGERLCQSKLSLDLLGRLA